MSGFTALISKTDSLPQDSTFRPKNLFGHESDFIYRKLQSPKIKIEQFTNQKFLNDKVLDEDDSFMIGLEGVILNLPQLKDLTCKQTVFEVIKQLYLSYADDFILKLRGDFSGFIYSKQADKWLVFTNPTGSKRLFYFENTHFFIFASDLKEISFLLTQLSIPFQLDMNAVYSLLTYGFMLQDLTIISEVKRLSPGSKINIDNFELTINEYFNLKNIPETTDDKSKIIENMDILFRKAVGLEFEKDKAYHYKHVATLSGGLDSRMTVLVADKLGYKEQLNFNFSESNYLDELISKEIASDFRHQFLFQSLDNGNFLKELDKTVYYNDGLILYSGSCHLLSALENINFEPYGLIHTGLVGDAVLGSFLSQPFPVKPTASQGAYSTKLMSRIHSYAETVVVQYENEELYKFYSRAFLGAMNGNNYMDIFSQTVSPFLDLDFLSYCYSIPYKYKYKSGIYIDWITSLYPEVNRYRWEKTGVNPSKSMNYLKYFDLHFYRRMQLKWLDRRNNKMNTGMNPFDKWYDKNPELKDFVIDYFNKNIELLHAFPALQADCKWLYEVGTLNEKLQVLTLLSAYRLHFQTLN
jgi:asparagine synthase (glutamine-hydrolysing)